MVGVLASLGVCTSLPWWYMLPTTMVGMYSLLPWWVYTLLHPPGYTSRTHWTQHRYTARTGSGRFTALAQGVTEQYVSDAPLTVRFTRFPVGSPLTRFTVGLDQAALFQRWKRRGRHVAKRGLSLQPPVSLLDFILLSVLHPIYGRMGRVLSSFD